MKHLCIKYGLLLFHAGRRDPVSSILCRTLGVFLFHHHPLLMPFVNVDYSAVSSILRSENEASRDHFDQLISTPFGLLMLEIQGELNLPSEVPSEDDRSGQLSNFAIINDIYHAVRFGKLDFDEIDPSKVTLFIGKSQRLLGTIVNLDNPLGVLRIPTRLEGQNETGEDIKIVDIVKKKIIFKQRPLPIM